MQNLEIALKAYISAQGRKPCDPFALLLVTLKSYSGSVLNDANDLGHQAAVLERTTGLGSFAYSAQPEIRIEDLKTKHMSWLIGNLRIAHKALDFQTELIAFVQNQHLKLLSYKASKSISIDSLRGPSRDIHEAFQALKNSMEWKRNAFRIETRDRAQSLYEGVSRSSSKMRYRLCAENAADQENR